MSFSKSIPLVSDTLQLSPFQQQYRTPTLSAFVSDQKRYQKHYIQEGIAAFEACMELSSGQTKDCIPSQSASIKAMCTSSPLLRPRVPEARQPVEVPGAALQMRNGAKILRPASVHKVTEELVDEHASRLQQRRERRSAKKAILNPKPPPEPYYDPQASGSATDSSSLSQRQTYSRKEKRSQKRQKHRPQRDKGKAIKKKKSGRSSSCRRGSVVSAPQQLPPKRKRINQISAGLSLMHNFDARNIVRSRITLKQPPKLGVFNKGMASAPTKVNRKQHHKARGKDLGHIFSEYTFLNRTRPLKPPPSVGTSGSRSGSSTSSESDNVEEDRLSSETPMGERTIKFDQKKISKFFPSSRPAPSNTPNITPRLKSLQSIETSNYNREDGASLDQSKCRARLESPPWDIDWEAEGLDSPNSEHSSVKGCDRPATVDRHEKGHHTVVDDYNASRSLDNPPGSSGNPYDMEYSFCPGTIDTQPTPTTRDANEWVPTEDQSFALSHGTQELENEIQYDKLLEPSGLIAQGSDDAYLRDEPLPLLMPSNQKISSFGSGSLTQLAPRTAPGYFREALATGIQDYCGYEEIPCQDQDLNGDLGFRGAYDSFWPCSSSEQGQRVGRADFQNTPSGILDYSHDRTEYCLDSLPYTDDGGLIDSQLGPRYADEELSFRMGYYEQGAEATCGPDGSVTSNGIQAYDSTSLPEGRTSSAHYVESQTTASVPYHQLNGPLPHQVGWSSPSVCDGSPANISNFSCASTEVSSAKDYTERFQEGRALLLGFDAASENSSGWMEEEDEERKLVKTLLGNGSASWWGKGRRG